jgi:hypothetical protein
MRAAVDAAPDQVAAEIPKDVPDRARWKIRIDVDAERVRVTNELTGIEALTVPVDLGRGERVGILAAVESAVTQTADGIRAEGWPLEWFGLRVLAPADYVSVLEAGRCRDVVLSRPVDRIRGLLGGFGEWSAETAQVLRQAECL